MSGRTNTTRGGTVRSFVLSLVRSLACQKWSSGTGEGLAGCQSRRRRRATVLPSIGRSTYYGPTHTHTHTHTHTRARARDGANDWSGWLVVREFPPFPPRSRFRDHSRQEQGRARHSVLLTCARSRAQTGHTHAHACIGAVVYDFSSI